MKSSMRRIASTSSLSEQGVNGTATSTTPPTRTERPNPPPQTNEQPTQKPNGLPAPPQDPRPKKKLKPRPRPNPAASLFIPSKKVRPLPRCHQDKLTTFRRGHLQMQIWQDQVRGGIRLRVYPGISLCIGFASPLSAYARHINPGIIYLASYGIYTYNLYP